MSNPRAETLERPVLNPAFVAVASDRNTIEIRAGPWSGTVMTIRETDNDESLEPLFSKLDGTHAIEDVLASYDEAGQEAIRSLFDALAEKNVLFDAADWEGNVGRPQLSVLSRFDEETDRRLDESSVLVVSVGEIGLQVAADLLRSGVGRVTLHRPMRGDDCADTDSGWLLEHLADQRGFELSDASIRDSLEAADVAVFAADTDRPGIAAAFNEAAHETGTPWLLAQVRGFDGIVGPTVIPAETACYRCLERRIAANVPDADSYAAYRDGIANEPSTASLGLPSFARMVAGYATVDLLYLLAYGQAFTVGRMIAVDFLDLSVEINEVLKLPRCDVCGRESGTDVKRFISIEDLRSSEAWNRRTIEGE